MTRPSSEEMPLAYEMLVDHLTQLGAHQLHQFHTHGRLPALNEAISCFRQAVTAISPDVDNSLLPDVLTSYIVALELRFARCGDVADLNISIHSQRQGLTLATDDKLERQEMLVNISSSLGQRFKCTGDLTDISSAIEYLLQADGLAEDGSPFKPLILTNLGSSLGDRYSMLRDPEDLEASIRYKRRALALVDNADPRRVHLLSNLAGSLLKLFHCHGHMEDLEDSIRTHNDALQRAPEGHPLRLACLCRLGGAQMARFKRLGELADMEDSIANYQEAVSQTIDGDPKKYSYLTDLGCSQHMRYSRLGELPDLELALSNLRASVALLHDDHHQFPGLLLNLAEAELSRFVRVKESSDIENAVAHMQHAVTLTAGQPNPEWLSDLACTQQVRFVHRGSLDDLESAIANLRQALALTEDSHAYSPYYLSNLGDALTKLSRETDNEANLREAIEILEVAAQIFDDEHAEKVKCLYRLGLAFAQLYNRTSDSADLESCISALRPASQARTAYPQIALAAARKWAVVATEANDLESALEAYKTMLDLLPKIAWLGLSTESRQNWLSEQGSETLTTLAASCAIRLGRLETAVELLDLSRSVLWQQGASLRVDLGRLRDVESQLAEELEVLGRQLDAGMFSDEASYSTPGGDETVASRYRLVARWEGLVDRVRMLPQFRYFLKPVPFGQLRKAAKGGHIIVLNVSFAGVDALIFDSDSTHSIEHIPLPNLSLHSLTELSSDIILKRPLHGTAEQHRRYLKTFFRPALRTVWDDMVAPIFSRMNIPTSVSHLAFPERRIWWYPTGPATFLPIHAAGPGGALDVSRLVVSSYINNVDSLLKARQHKLTNLDSPPKLLVVSQPNTIGQKPLPMATYEAAELKEIVASAKWPEENIVQLNGSEATVSSVSSALDTSSHIHFACHGLQHPFLGMKSAFALHDGFLELGQIASKRMTAGRFAFLSVCHAAAGLRHLPGESMHLAAGLQFSGFPSVVGTMWSIADDDAPVIARYFYEYMLRNGVGAFDPEEAAVALNRAVLKLRETGKVPVDRWAPFIHLGV
ncbi:hypothetical protein HWV62_31867 [Athelia sp. TMB]|nr:hypothetical protein HWV62_31867 [Athelia sp. TMB]